MKRILVTGSRDWTDDAKLDWAIMNELQEGEDAVIVHGGARGADWMAETAAIAWGVQSEVHRADWEKYGKRAGFVRNQEMVDAGADVCLAFIRNNSRGATMCAQLAEKAGIPVKYFRIDDDEH